MQFLREVDQQNIADYWFGGDIAQVDDIITTVDVGSHLHGFGPFMDELRETLPDFHNDTTMIIPEIEPEVLADSFGSDAVIWAAAHARGWESGSRHYESMRTLTGEDPGDVRQAIYWTKRPLRTASLRNIQLQLGLTGFLNDAQKLDVPSLVQAHPAEGVTISDNRAEKYGFVMIQPDRKAVEGHSYPVWPNSDRVSYEFYLDEPGAVVLTYNEQPIAFAGYGARPDNGIGILQIQGVTGKKIEKSKERVRGETKFSPRGLAPLDWRGIFVNLAAIAAERTGATSLAIPEGRTKCNAPNAPDGTPRSLPMDAAKRNYDDPAEDHGFSPPILGYWHRAAAA